MITVKAKLSLLTICIALPFGTLAQTGMTTEQRFELMEQRLQAAEQRANKAEAEIASLKKAQTQPSAVNTATAAPQQVASVADNKKPVLNVGKDVELKFYEGCGIQHGCGQ